MKFFTKAIILVLFAAILTFAGCKSLADKEKMILKEVDQKQLSPLEQKKADLKKAIEKDYQNAEAHYELGQIYQKEGLWSQAEFEYNIALSFDPTHREAQAGVVKCLAAMNENPRAEMAAEIYKNQVAGSAKESLLLAIAFQQQGLEEYAFECYKKALNLAPNSYRVNRQIGLYYLSKGDNARAQQYLTRSIQINPNQPDIAQELGKMGVQVEIPKEPEKSSFLDKLFDKVTKQNKKEESKKN